METFEATRSPEGVKNIPLLFSQTFMLSQGNILTQKLIFRLLANGPMKGQKITGESFPSPDSTVSFAQSVEGKKMHKEIRPSLANPPAWIPYLYDRAEHKRRVFAREAAERRRDFLVAFENPHAGTEDMEDGERLDSLLKSLLVRMVGSDYRWLKSASGRPVGKNKERDKRSSFFIDFCIFGRGTPPWTLDRLSPPLREICVLLGSRYQEMMETGTAVNLYWITKKYLQTHAGLSDMDKERLKLIQVEIANRLGYTP